MLLRKLLFKQNRFFDISKGYFASKAKENLTRMAEHGYIGNSLKVILDRLEAFASPDLASTWDNVGLLVDPMTDTEIKNILLTNDLTEDVVQEAITCKCSLIVSYHPNIFQGMKSVSNRTWKERIVIECIKNNIAVYSPHTSWDAVKGGVNDWLGSAFPIRSSTPIIPVNDYPEYGAGRYIVLDKPITVSDAVNLVKGLIGIAHVRLALARNKDQESLIRSVALCAGSGNSVLTGVEADLYLTGEMLHHDVLDATQKNIHVILCNHSDSERGFFKGFQEKLEKDILKGEAKVLISTMDSDPLKTV